MQSNYVEKKLHTCNPMMKKSAAHAMLTNLLERTSAQQPSCPIKLTSTKTVPRK